MLKYLITGFVTAIMMQCGSSVAQNSASITEDFEDKGTKSGYKAEKVAFKSGDWLLDNALVGAEENDTRNGYRALRIKQGGVVTTNFCVKGAVNSVSFAYATYNGAKDTKGTIELWYSLDKGKTWKQADEAISVESTTFAKANISVRSKRSVVLQWRNTSAKGCRINIDDVVISGDNMQTEAVELDAAPTNDEVADNTDNPKPKKQGKKDGNSALAQEHLVLGNPSGATESESDYDNYLMLKDEYSVSYNRSKGIANWVAWRCGAFWNGTTQRANDFRPDPALPSDWFRAKTNDYSGSGFDRGHLCSSGDRDNTPTNNSATFLMTNIIPQAPNNNQGAWNALELYIRGLVDSGNEVYCFAGPYGRGGEGKNGKMTTMADGNITVPASVWKVVLILPEGDNDLKRINKQTRAFAVRMPNNQSVGKENWRSYIVAIDEIEKITGYDFFSNLPKDVQAVIEAKTNE